MTLEPFLQAAVRTATPLALAALGETVVERAGIINIGLEGIVLAGAFGGLLGAGTGSVALGFVAAAAAGLALGCVFALFAVTLRADQIIAGTGINLLALGLTGTLYRQLYGAGGAALSIPTTGPVALPVLSHLPVAGGMLFSQAWPTYLVYALIPAIWWMLYRTHAGLALRAVGERPEAAVVAAVPIGRVRWMAVSAGSVLGGLAGGMLVLAQAGTFAENMSAGRGFIAIGIVVLGRWHPVGVGIAAFIFGGASALQFLFQAAGWHLPYQLFLAFPYVLTLVALAAARGRTAAPASLGRP
ncbi:MAG TPA: ABC transporter permease [Gemmatimonadaceae bacterium]|nr:ABC transporter permease [Gemmatimonadaceae bacterium]